MKDEHEKSENKMGIWDLYSPNSKSLFNGYAWENQGYLLKLFLVWKKENFCLNLGALH